MGPDLTAFSNSLHSEVEKYIKSQPGKSKNEALEKLYIRFTKVDGNDVFVVEKKSFLTRVKNLFSSERKKQYDFESNFKEIISRFPPAVKDEAKYNELCTLAAELNEILSHVNHRRDEKHKKPYDLKQIKVAYEAPAPQQQPQQEFKEAPSNQLSNDPVSQPQAPTNGPEAQEKAPEQPVKSVQMPPQENLPGKLDKSKIPSQEQQRVMLEGISGGKVDVAFDPVQAQDGALNQPEQNEPAEEPQRQIRELPRKDKNRRPITKGEAFKRMQSKPAEVPRQPETQKPEKLKPEKLKPAKQKAPPKAPVRRHATDTSPVASASKPAVKTVPAELREFARTNSKLFQDWLRVDLLEVIEANPEDPIKAFADALKDDTLMDHFSKRVSPVATRPAGWLDVVFSLAWNTANDYRPLISGLVRDMNIQFKDLVETGFKHARQGDSARKSMATLNKMANLFERAEFLLSAHDDTSDNYVTAKYVEAHLLAEKLYEAVNKEYGEYEADRLPSEVKKLRECLDKIHPNFINKDGTMKSLIRHIGTKGSDLNEALGALREASEKCSEKGFPPNEHFKEFSERILPPL